MFNTKTTLLVLVVVGALGLAACSDDSTAPSTPDPSLLTGLVTDATGAPLAGAGILMGFQQPAQTRPSTEIAFVIPEAGPVKFWIENDCYSDTLRVLWDGPLPAGSHSLVWDGRDSDGLTVPSGKYTYHLQAPSDLAVRDLYLFLETFTPDTDPANYRLQATTDAQGKFTMEQDCLPFGEVVEMTNAQGEPVDSWIIPRQVRFIALHRDHDTATSHWVMAHPDTGCYIQFSFP